jgi:D-alanine-D-alanine ligase
VVNHLVVIEPEWKAKREAVVDEIRKSFPLPFFVKPANLGSSVGISKVKNFTASARAIRLAFRFDRKILIEEGIIGRELECSVLGNETPEASLPGEIFPHREFYDYRDKYLDDKTRFGIPADLPAAMTRKIRECAVRAFKAVDCSGMARVDFLLRSATNELFVSEVNTIPGFTEISMYPKLWDVSGLPFPDLLDRLIVLGMEKHRSKKICVARGPS